MDEEAAKNGKCEIVCGSPESWLSKEWRKQLQEGQLGMQTVAIAIDEVHSITEWCDLCCSRSLLNKASRLRFRR